MSLNIEWRRRVERWMEELPRHFYHPLGSIPLQGFVTTEQLTPEEALKRTFKPMPPGTKWGAKWEYGWFKGEVTLPEASAGKRIALRVEPGEESAIFVNGVIVGAKDYGHHEITLSRNGVPGTHYDLLMETYAGHGPRVCITGPTPPDRLTVPEPPPTQAVVGESTFGIWEEEIYQLWLDVRTLLELRDNIDQNSLRVSEIDAGLRDFTLIVDYEVPREQMLETVAKARARLKPLLECVNGSTTPELFGFGHAHIDVAWLWPLAETERKAGRTFSTQLSLMEEYPEFKFLQSQPHLYRMVKNRYPELYERVKAAAKAGQFIPDGSTWVEPDTNITSGESLVRQFMHGKRFFKEEFGADCEFLWLPDVFGYSAALPQIMRGCGVKYFSTAKIYWAYTGSDPFVLTTFTWEGIDGSEVIVSMSDDYNSTTNPAAVIQRWNNRPQKDGISTRIFPFGHGDGGGGATRDHLEFARRLKNLEGAPRVRLASPIEFFRDLEKRGIPKDRYVGELYFAAHRGTYTSQARTKRGNRKSELALREAEMWSAAAGALKGYTVPQKTLDEAWKTVLLNHFHDILPGSSIHRVYEEAEAAFAGVIRTAEQICREAAGQITGRPGGYTVFNSLSWQRTALLPLPQGASTSAPSQVIDGKTYVEVTVPPCGWAPLQPNNDASSTLKAAPDRLENDLICVRFNQKGEITSIFDKETGKELAAGLCNSLKMYKDIPILWDAWDIDSMYELTPVELDEPAQIEVVSVGPLAAVLHLTRRINQSTLRQEIVLRRGSRRVDFRTTVDWQESHKMLKVNFPVNFHANEAIHEIQFGHIRRPTHRSRKYDADRFEVPAHKWTCLAEENGGFAVLNDCKYGVGVDGNSINLTLLKSAMGPDMTADKGEQIFTYAFYAWNGSFNDCDLVREGYDLNVPVVLIPGTAEQYSLFSLDAANIILDTVKPAEDGSGDIVLRLYEAKRAATSCTLHTTLPVKSVLVTNMLEEPQGTLEVKGGDIPLKFRAFEVKTIRLKLS